MWQMLMTIMAVVMLAALFYLVRCFHALSPFQRIAERHRALSWLAAILPLGLVGLFAFINVTTMAVVMLHLVAGFALTGLCAWIVGKVQGRAVSPDARGIAAVGLTAIYLAVGWFMAHHVFITRYDVTLDKPLADTLRIVEIADAHLGITLDGKAFAAQMARVQALEPDTVVVVGDFVDDDSRAEDMLEACRALGALKSTYGVYFVYGNHDEGYFRHRDFTGAVLREALEDNGVIVLTDESVVLDNSWVLVGRKDRSRIGRMDAAALTEGLDATKPIIMLDHQPNDYDNEAASGADLVLSGHTHGGHILPAGWLGLMMGANDRVYGMEVRGNTTFIVSSGISGWAIPFKTGTFSEIAVIDIHGAAK